MMHVDIEARALAAFYRYRTPGAIYQQPSEALTEVVERDGKRYVVLANIRGPLAVYLIRQSSGALMRLPEIPDWVLAGDESNDEYAEVSP